MYFYYILLNEVFKIVYFSWSLKALYILLRSVIIGIVVYKVGNLKSECEFSIILSY